MKKLILICILLITIFSNPSFGLLGEGGFTSTTKVFAQEPPLPTPPMPPATPPAPSNLNIQGGVNPSDSSIWNVILPSLDQALARIIKVVAIGILTFFGWILGYAGLAFDYSIKYLVVGMGGLLRTGGFGGPIEELWVIIRDLVNLTFVFSLIYIGLSTIVKGSTSNAKNLLASVIVSALLVNFSLYFAKVIVDISNFTANTIYTEMTKSSTAGANVSLSAAFMSHLNVSQLMLGGGNQNTTLSSFLNAALGSESSNGSSGESVVVVLMYALGAGLLMFKLTFAFALGAFLLILRFAMIIFLLIFSPIAFLPSALPQLSGYRQQWWSAMLNQAFLAPVFLFGIYMCYTILARIPNHQKSDGMLVLFTGQGDLSSRAQILLFYILAIIMIVGATMMAKKMSAAGASFTQTATGWADKKLKGSMNALMVKPGVYAAKGTASWTGRNTVGRLAYSTAKLNDKLERTKVGRFGKGLLSVASLGTLDEEYRRKYLKQMQESKFGGSRSRKDVKEFEKEKNKTRSEQERSYNRNKALAEHTDKELAYTQKLAEWNKLTTAEQSANVNGNTPVWQELKALQTSADAARKSATDEVQKMSNTELEKLSLNELKNIAHILSNKQADAVKDNKDTWTEAQKAEFKTHRDTLQLDEYLANPERFLGGMKPADIAKLGKKILLNKEEYTKPEDAYKRRNRMIILNYTNGEVARKIQDEAVFTREEARDFAKRMRQDVTDMADDLKQDITQSHIKPDSTGIKYTSDTPRGLGYYGTPEPTTTHTPIRTPPPSTGGGSTPRPAFIPPGSTGPTPAFVPPGTTPPGGGTAPTP